MKIINKVMKNNLIKDYDFSENYGSFLKRIRSVPLKWLLLNKFEEITHFKPTKLNLSRFGIFFDKNEFEYKLKKLF